MTPQRNKRSPHVIHAVQRAFYAGLAVALLLLLTGAIHAQSTSWTGTFSDDWYLSGNWTNGVPNYGNAIFDYHSMHNLSVYTFANIWETYSITFAAGVPGSVSLGPGMTFYFGAGYGDITCTDSVHSHEIWSDLSYGGDATMRIGIGGDVTIYGDITSAFLTKFGGGTLTLAGTNSYTGGTWIEAGTISVSGGSAIPDSGTVRMKDNTILALEANETIGSLEGTGAVHLDSYELTLGENGVNTTFSGTITGSGSLTKQGTGTLTLSGTNHYIGTTTINAGTINADSGSAIYDNGTVVINSNGTLALGASETIGSLTGNGTVNLNQFNLTLGKDGVDSSFTGTITGSGGLIKQGTGNFTLSGTHSYTGATTINAGTLTVGGGSVISDSGMVTIASVGTLALDASETIGALEGSGTVNLSTFDLTLGKSDADSSFSGTINGSGGLIKQGTGTFTLSGTNNYTGLTTAAEGKLVVNGTLSGDLTVSSGTRFGGNATVVNLINNGTIGPGNSIGTINVTGDFATDSGSVTEIEIDEAGLCDVINVTGSATIQSGATLKVIPLDTIISSEDYTFMTTGSGISGEFTLLDTSLIDFTAAVQGNDYHIIINRSPFQRVARTWNQHRISPYIERTYVSATGDYLNVLNEMLWLSTDDEVRNAMDQLDGELYPTLSIANLQATSNFNRMIADQLRPGIDTDSANHRHTTSSIMLDEKVVRAQNNGGNLWTSWITSYGLGGQASDDGNAHGYDYSTGGLAVGIDRQLNDHIQFGLLYGNGFASTRLNGLTASSSINSHLFGAYLKGRYADWYSTTLFNMGFDDYDSHRHIAFNTIDRTTQSKHDGWQSTVYQEIGRTLPFRRGSYFQPYAALQYIYLRQNGFNETGADSVDLQVGGQNLNSLRTIFGGRLITQHHISWLGNNELAFRTHWMHELLNQTTGLVTADLTGGGTPGFDVRGVNLGRDWIVLGPEIKWQYNNHIQLRATYDLTFNANQSYHTGSGNVTYTW